MGSVNLDFWRMLLIYSLLVIPIGVVAWLKLGLLKESLVAILRMTVQLGLVGLYLQYIFNSNFWSLTFLWMLVMLGVANYSVLKSSGLTLKIFMYTFAAISFSSVLVVAFFVFVVIRPEPVYDARYLIPIFGMLLGNCMRGNVISLDRFYHGIREREQEFITFQLMGATPIEASRPFMRQAIKASLQPHISTIATIGIVSLPGMMTGQILGGAFPVEAIKYQLAIMICIFATMTLGSCLNLLLSSRSAFDSYGMLRSGIFVVSKSKRG